MILFYYVCEKFTASCLKLYDKDCHLSSLWFIPMPEYKWQTFRGYTRETTLVFWWNYWRLRISKSNKDDVLVSRSALADTTWAMIVETQPTKIHGVSRGIESMPGRNILNSGHIFAFLYKSAGCSIEGNIYSYIPYSWHFSHFSPNPQAKLLFDMSMFQR